MATYYTVRALVAIAALAAGTATATTTTTTTTTATATATSTTGATLATKGGENGGDDDGDDVMVAYHPMLNVWKMARDCREGNPSVSNIHFLNHRLGEVSSRSLRIRLCLRVATGLTRKVEEYVRAKARLPQDEADWSRFIFGERHANVRQHSRKMDAYLLLMFFLVLTVLTISIGLAIKMEQKKSRRNQESLNDSTSPPPSYESATAQVPPPPKYEDSVLTNINSP